MYTTTRCPHCQSTFEVERSHLGQEAECLECGQVFRLWDAGASAIVQGGDPDDVVLDARFGFSSVLGLVFGTVFGPAWGPLMLGVLVLFGLGIAGGVMSMAITSVFGPNSGIGAAVDLVTSFALQLLVANPVTFGVMYLGMQACRGFQVEVGDVFVGFRRYADMILVSLIQIGIGIGVLIGCVVLVLPGVLVLGLTNGGQGGGGVVGAVVLGVGGLAALLLAIWVTLRFALAPIALLDEHRGRVNAIEAFGESWRLMRGKVFPSAVAGVVVVITAVASVLLLCIGYLLIGMPLLMTFYGAVYALVVSDEHRGGGRPAADAGPRPQAWPESPMA